jgi:hypothetical protein
MQYVHAAWRHTVVMGIDRKHRHAALACRVGIQNGYAAWTSSMDIQHLFFCSYTCQLFASVVTVPRINTHFQARSYGTYGMVHGQHGDKEHGDEAWACSIECRMHMQNGHAGWTSSMDKHGKAA